MSEIIVYTARAIHTMEPSLRRPRPLPCATADFGSRQPCEPAALARPAPHRIDESFADKTILPGFIDPHLHPSMAAVLLPMQFITALAWDLPWESVPATKTHEAYLARLAELAGQDDTDEPFFTWGYHRNWHGNISRAELDAACAGRPVVVWHRSFHEVIMNSAALAHFGLDSNEAGSHPQVKLDEGLFYENGLRLAINAMNPVIMSPEKFGLGIKRLKQVAHFGAAAR